ncbi:DGQHR domain-containing protein [Neptuniibacter sp. CAU 1671]|uniref:DGQHR domain-containing protein n=1 Tax=Neptuniibacter sp. CAU 1671 TaxID=3032593 RepID=UPI0023DB4E21|nr:DGQHR domain-containing protein [Neptuniibacter sp. CAU 1671]MDF2180967.1 DGQHR domain-containing protein [Neptuniibacter sp. CAU 1671]
MSTKDMTLLNGEEVVSFKCLEVRQPIGPFYIGSISSKDLINITYSDVRRIEAEERGFERYLGIQRPLSRKRVNEIADYTNTLDASFPTSVILSIPSACANYDESTGMMTLAPYFGDDGDNIPYSEIAKVIDGQHRIEGLNGFKGDDFDINVSIFIDLDVSSEAYIFSTVNLAQTKVNRSLVYDLYDLAKSRSPQKLCHNIAVVLNKEEDSPFYKRIKRLGTAVKDSHSSSITQAAFVKALMKYISREEQKDRDIYLRGKTPVLEERDRERLIFRSFMIDERDFDLTDIIWNYFSAVKSRWPKAWDDPVLMLSKTNGFMALMRLLKDFVLQEDAIGTVITEDRFKQFFDGINIPDDDFTVDKYKPGSTGEGQLYRDLKERAGW